MTVVDVHTHMLTLDWIELLRTRGRGEQRERRSGKRAARQSHDAAPMG